MFQDNISDYSHPDVDNSVSSRYGPLEFVNTLPALAIILIIVLIVAALVGTLGNLLILISVATTKALQNVESVFVVNLACSDLYVTLIADPLSIVGKTAGWKFFASVPGLCQAVGSLCTISCVGSLATLSAMACNRYVLIVHPRYYRTIFTLRNSLIMCFSFYFLGLLLVCLNFIGVGDHSFDHKSLECIWDRMANHNYTIIFAIVLVWAPMLVTGLAYSRLYMHVRKAGMKVHKQKGNSGIRATLSMASREESSMYNKMSKKIDKTNAVDVIELKPMLCKKKQTENSESGVLKPLNPNVLTTQLSEGLASAPSSEFRGGHCEDEQVNDSGSKWVEDEDTPSHTVTKDQPSNLSTCGISKMSAHSSQEHNISYSSRTSQNHAFKLAWTLFIIYLVFSVCWLPFSLLLILDAKDTFAHELHVVIVAWAHLHPSINWLVYYHTHSKFRSAFRKLLRLDVCCP